jgi:hypothetical protein
VTIDRAAAAEFDQRNFFFLPRLEANRRAGGDIETNSVGSLAIERQRPIDFGKVIVTPDLHGAIAGVPDYYSRYAAAGVQLYIIGAEKKLSRVHANSY